MDRSLADRPFHGLDLDQSGKIRQNHRKARLKLVKLPSLKVIRLKRAKTWLCKVAKAYKRLRPIIQTSVKFRDFEELCVRYLKALFPAELTNVS